MVVRLRLAMHGNRHNKLFHIVAINSTKRRNARPIETLGVYRHTIDNSKDRVAKSVDWSVERIKYWLRVGAQPSESVAKLCIKGGILPPNLKDRSKGKASIGVSPEVDSSAHAVASPN